MGGEHEWPGPSTCSGLKVTVAMVTAPPGMFGGVAKVSLLPHKKKCISKTKSDLWIKVQPVSRRDAVWAG